MLQILYSVSSRFTKERELYRIGQEQYKLLKMSPYELDKPSLGYSFRYRFRVVPSRFCSDGNPTTLSILLWSYLILSDTHIIYGEIMPRNSEMFVPFSFGYWLDSHRPLQNQQGWTSMTTTESWTNWQKKTNLLVAIIYMLGLLRKKKRCPYDYMTDFS